MYHYIELQRRRTERATDKALLYGIGVGFVVGILTALAGMGAL